MTAWQALFAPVPGERAAKVRCLLCGATGWGGGQHPSPWQRKCIAGHPYRCEVCRRPFTCRSAIAAHQRCKAHHGCCPSHTTVPAWKNPFDSSRGELDAEIAGSERRVA